jgi:hypothetical protein
MMRETNLHALVLQARVEQNDEAWVPPVDLLFDIAKFVNDIKPFFE